MREPSGRLTVPLAGFSINAAVPGATPPTEMVIKKHVFDLFNRNVTKITESVVSGKTK